MPFKSINHTVLLGIIFLFFNQTAFAKEAVGAKSPVDKSVPLKAVSQEFGLADGPAWDGRWNLYVPDVKGEKLFRYIPQKKTWHTVLPKAGRISASYYSHGRLFLLIIEQGAFRFWMG